jgi:hypothetical protein
MLDVAGDGEPWGLCLLQEDHLAKKWGTKDSFQILEELVAQDLKASMVTNQFFREERDERRNLCMETNRKNCHFAFQTNERVHDVFLHSSHETHLVSWPIQ